MTLPLIEDQFTESVERNHFPVVLQLTVLALVLCGVFGTLWVLDDSQDKSQSPSPVTERTYTPLHTAASTTIPTNLADVSLTAEAAYVWDVRGQRALYRKNETQALPLASISKLMTALVAYELIEGEESVTVPLSAIRQEGNSGLVAGEVLSIEELTEFALITSSNDAAYTLAASVGGLLGERDPAAQFVAGMNIRAEELGLSSLEFSNMTGLDISTTQPGAVGSAKDVSFLMEYLVEQYPEVLEPTKNTQSRVYNSAGAYHDLSNTNVVADRIPNLIGSKTGYTDLAGGNLTVAYDLGHNRPIVITVLGSTRDARFTDVLTLIDAVEQSVTTTLHE